MKKCILILSAICLLLHANTAHGDEGMWLPPTIDTSVARKLYKRGLTRPVGELASFNTPSIKDAIVQLNTGCTGSIISRKGLVLTNYHCVTNAIQQHANAQPNMLPDGYYAEALANELPIEGMTIAITTAMVDVSREVLNGVSPRATYTEAKPLVSQNIARILDTASQHEGVQTRIVQHFGGNRYLLVSQKVFRDVRLVFLPPKSIGNFGGDTDNWQYPRHTGDFAMLRVYSNANNEPADYSPQNQPYSPKKFLSIAQDGYSEGDLTIIMGYPGSTQRYATSWEIDRNINHVNKAQREVWEQLIPIWDSIATANPTFAVEILPQREAVANYLKYYTLQAQALQRKSVIQQRDANVNSFCAWYAQNPERAKKYIGATSNIQNGVQDVLPQTYQYTVLREAFWMGMPLANWAASFETLANALKEKDKAGIEAFRKLYSDSQLDAFFATFDPQLDKISTAAMLKLCMEKLPLPVQPSVMKTIRGQYHGSVQAFLNDAYAKSLFVSQEKVNAFLDSPSRKTLENDPIYAIAASMGIAIGKLENEMQTAEQLVEDGRQRYLEGVLEQNANTPLYPDADGTLRISYGEVKSFAPADGIHLSHYTTVDGMAEKAKQAKPEYKMAPHLARMQANDAFSGFQIAPGLMPLNFITTNDIIGGNSGSPVLSYNGSLIGLAFDLNEGGASGQYQFDNEQNRSICVDIRFILLLTKAQKNTRVFEELSIFGKRRAQ